MKILVIIYKILFWFIFFTLSSALFLYFRAYIILGRTPSLRNEEEAYTFGFEKFVYVLGYFYSIAVLIGPISVIILLFTVLRYKYKPSITFSILIVSTYCVAIVVMYLNIFRLYSWLLG